MIFYKIKYLLCTMKMFFKRSIFLVIIVNNVKWNDGKVMCMGNVLSLSLLLCIILTVLDLGPQRSRWFGQFCEIGRTQILWNMRNINQKYKRQKTKNKYRYIIFKKYIPSKVSVRERFSRREDVKLGLQLKWRRGVPQQQRRAERHRGGDWWWCVINTLC